MHHPVFLNITRRYNISRSKWYVYFIPVSFEDRLSNLNSMTVKISPSGNRGLHWLMPSPKQKLVVWYGSHLPAQVGCGFRPARANETRNWFHKWCLFSLNQTVFRFKLQDQVRKSVWRFGMTTSYQDLYYVFSLYKYIDNILNNIYVKT